MHIDRLIKRQIKGPRIQKIDWSFWRMEIIAFATELICKASIAIQPLYCTMKQESFIHCYRFVNKFILKCHIFDRLCEKFNSAGTWITNNHSQLMLFITHTHTTVVSKVCIHFDRVSKFHGCLPFVRFILQNLWQDTTHYAWFIICACMYMNACLSVSLCRLSIIRCNFIYAVNLPKIFSIKAGINVFEI